MSLEILALPVEGTHKTAVFRSMSISQSPDGQYYVDGKYDIVIKDTDGRILAVTKQITFSFMHDDLLANPNFPTSYAALRDLARRGLRQSVPEFVTPDQP